MRRLAPISWSEGMFLKPHHFQQADGFRNARLAHHLQTSEPFHWGVSTLRLDVEALENMVLRVIECDVVFPDGLVVRAPSDAVLAEQSFQDQFPATASVLDVYLTVRTEGASTDDEPRFVRERERRADMFLTDNDQEVEVLVPRATVLFATGPAEERLAGRDAVRIARVRRTGRTAPRFELVPDYAPPSLSVRSSPVLRDLVDSVIARLRSTADVFGQFRRERGPEALGYGVGDFEQLLARQLLSQYIPAFRHGIANDAWHPYDAYGLLVELRGGLTSYFPDGDAAAFPDYGHEDLGPRFVKVVRDIEELLERLLPVHYKKIDLARDDTQFSAPIGDDLFQSGSMWVLGLHCGLAEDELKGEVKDKAKVTSLPDMPKIRNLSISGVPLKFLTVPPAQIPRYAGWSYFEADVGSGAWRRVRDDRSFAFDLVGAPADMEASLFVVLREQERARA